MPHERLRLDRWRLLWRGALLLCALVALAPMRESRADIISTTGNLIMGVSTGNVAVLNANGLGIGVAVPSANLHVAGNAIVSNRLGIGITAPVSTLDVSGTLGFGIQSVSSNTTLSGNSVVLADTSAGNMWLVLPVAAAVSGRTYCIKKTTALNTLTVYHGIDGNESMALTSSSNGYPYLKLISASNAWWVTDLSGGVTANGIVASSNLVGYWRFDETSGTVAADAGSGNNSGNLNGGVTFSNNSFTGKVGQALNFDGVDDYVSVSAGNAILGTTYSVSIWFKLDTTKALHGIMESAETGTTKENTPNFLLQADTASLKSFCHGPGYSSTLATISTGLWYHFVSVRTPTNETCYVNGANVLSWTINNSNGIKNQINLGVGYNAFFDGLLDDVRFYNKALSAAEVQAIYQAAP